MRALTAYQFALIAVLLWSTVATAFKLSLVYLTPFQLLFYAAFVALTALSGMVVYQKKTKQTLCFLMSHWKTACVLGLLNPLAYYLFLFEGYKILPAQDAQVINYTWALTFTYLAAVFLNKKLTKVDFFAGLVCYFGVFVIATKGAITTFEFANYTGVVLILLSTLVWALYWVILARQNTDAIINLFASFATGTFFVAIYALVTNQDIAIHTPQAFIGVVYVGLFEMAVTFTIWLRAIQLASNVSKISNLIFLSPFVSLLLIYLFVGEDIHPSTIIALIMIVLVLLFQQKYSQSNTQ